MIVWVGGLAMGLTLARSAIGEVYQEQRLLLVARAAVAAEVRGEVSPSIAAVSPARPVFVTLERHGRVRGCRGALSVRTRSLEEEVALAARAAAAHDPRYPPLRRQELTDLTVTVTVISELRPLEDVASLLPADGLVLREGLRTGVVLPWEGKAPDVRLEWAYRKAGVPRGAPCRLFRLVGERFRG